MKIYDNYILNLKIFYKSCNIYYKSNINGVSPLETDDIHFGQIGTEKI